MQSHPRDNQFPGKADKSIFSTLIWLKIGFRLGISEKQSRNKTQHPRDTLCPNFQAKHWIQNLGLDLQKINVGIKISILEITCEPIFRYNGHFLLFRSKFAQKMILGLEFHNFKSGFWNQHLQTTMCANFQPKQTNLIFLAYIWGNCPITCNILILIMLRVLQRAGWSLKWAGGRCLEFGGGGWSWMEVGARFSNTIE